MGWAGLGGWGQGLDWGLHRVQVPESTLAEIKACVSQDLLISRDEGGMNEVGGQKQDQTSVVFHALGLSLCLHCHS